MVRETVEQFIDSKGNVLVINDRVKFHTDESLGTVKWDNSLEEYYIKMDEGDRLDRYVDDVSPVDFVKLT